MSIFFKFAIRMYKKVSKCGFFVVCSIDVQ